MKQNTWTEKVFTGPQTVGLSIGMAGMVGSFMGWEKGDTFDGIYWAVISLIFFALLVYATKRKFRIESDKETENETEL